MKVSRWFVPVVLVLTMVACGAPAGGSGDSPEEQALSVSPPVEVTRLGPAETAEALSAPESAADGVWSLLDNLGIGVYTSNGEQVLAGSETGPDDFWVYDFEVSLLARMATGPAHPFSDYHGLVTQFGIELSETDMLADYESLYSQHGDEFLVMFFEASDMTFEEGMQLTPLQEWLLFLDTFVPPNGEAAAQRGTVHLAAALPPAHVALQGGPCDAIAGDGSDTAWGFGWKVVGWARDAFKEGGSKAFPVDPADIIHALMMADAVSTSLTVTPEKAHEGHEGSDGGSVTYTAAASFDGEGIPDWVISCGAVAGFEVPPDGPLNMVMTEWEPNDVLTQHGTVRYPEQGGSAAVRQPITRDKGRVQVQWTAREEPAEGEGMGVIDDGWMEVTFRIQRGDVLNMWAGAQEWFLPRTERVRVDVGWHEVRWLLTMSATFQDGANYTTISWQGTFLVDEENQIYGVGDGDYLGFWPDTPCAVITEGGFEERTQTVDINGTFSFEIGGKQVGQDFQLEISGLGSDLTYAFSDQDCAQGVTYDPLTGPLFEGLAQSTNDWVPFNLIQIPARAGASTSIQIPGMTTLEVSVEASDSP